MKLGKWIVALSVLTTLVAAPLAQAQTKRDAAWYRRNGYVRTKSGTWSKRPARTAAWYRRNGYTRTSSGTWRKRDAAWYKRNGYVRSSSGTWRKKG